MSKLKHTPGPWNYDTNKDMDDFPYISIITDISALHKNFKIMCHIDNEKPTLYNETNARLIAAAPEMLERLICNIILKLESISIKDKTLFYGNLKNYVEHQIGNCLTLKNTKQWQCILDDINIIEKATGKKIEEIIS